MDSEGTNDTVTFLDQESLPLQSTCVNCGVKLSIDSCVAFYTMPTTTISVYQGLELIFKCREVPGDEVMPNLLKLCTSCGHFFGKTLKWYHKFVASTVNDTYVKHLIYGDGDPSIDASTLVKIEASDEGFDTHDNSSWLMDSVDDLKRSERDPLSSSPSETILVSRMIRQSNDPDQLVQMVQQEVESENVTLSINAATMNPNHGNASGRQKQCESTTVNKAKLIEAKKHKSDKDQSEPEGIDSENHSSESGDEIDEIESDDSEDNVVLLNVSPPTVGSRSSPRNKNKLGSQGARHVPRLLYKSKDRRSYILTSDEEGLLAYTDQYKCDSKECASGGVAFSTFKEWVVHQDAVHQLGTGYEYDIESNDILTPSSGKHRPCPRCGRKAPSHPKMLLHIRTVHLRMKQFSCDVCGRDFASRLGLKWHQKSAHSGAPNKFNCTICSSSFSSKAYLDDHEVSAHTGLRPFYCEEEGCNKNFRTNDALRSHVKRTHPDKQIKKVTNRRKARDMTDEEKDILATTEYKCDSDRCLGVWFPTFKSWVVHQESAHGVETGYKVDTTEPLCPAPGKIRPCPRCGKKFKSRFVLLTHVQSVHLRTGRVRCETCGRDFVNDLSLKQHRAVTHDGTAQKFLCSLCGASFNSKSYLQEHEEIHNGRLRRSKDCDICGAKFRRRYNLDLHKSEVHGQGEPSVCDICGKVFKVKQRMEIHKRRQHVKKAIIDQICELCGKGYAFKHYLKDHLMSVHKLSDDEARSLAKVKLPPAIRKYTVAVKPKTCEYCGRKYVRREQLFTHLMSVHGKTKEEATAITGLETKRELIPGSASRGKRAKKMPNVENVSMQIPTSAPMVSLPPPMPPPPMDNRPPEMHSFHHLHHQFPFYLG